MVLLRMSGGKQEKVVVRRVQQRYRGRPHKGHKDHTGDKGHAQHYQRDDDLYQELDTANTDDSESDA